MANQSLAIQNLLVAEKRAADKVTEARKQRQKRLKKAKNEAQDEIEKFRQEREKQFQEFESKYMGSRDAAAAQIDADIQVQIEEMIKVIDENKEKLIEDIIDLICDIKPEVHKNYLIRMKKEEEVLE
ncbi:V-type proton ATPase subunit G-like [Chironomus tepperi]|uniref:V-type proton ATPase subunit G-like n=1 Tax=Chironomus tepperi TaxID=113505 RepID=UPI00391F1CE9